MKKNGEIRYFLSQPKNIKTLLLTNMLFAMVLPIVEIFAGAYIMRNTGAASMVVVYQLCMYIGIALSAVVNGLLLKKINVKTLYSFGILVSAIALMVMMFIKNVNLTMICGTGFLLGLTTGFFWTNRYLLTLYSTNDDNRNYFFGTESFFFSLWNIVIPLAVGALLASVDGANFFGRTLNLQNGYQITTVLATVIAIIACIVLSRGDFKQPESKNFFYFKFHSLWYKMLSLASLKGMVQGFLVTAPAILILKFIGGEGELGLIQGAGGALTAVIVYVLGRVSKPKHRMAIFGTGLFVFFAGTLANCILFSAAGAYIFIICKIFFQPIHDLAYYPTMMKTIDYVSAIEKRDGYTYILSHELGLFAGRALGMILFIAIAGIFTEDIALRYALLIVGALQLISLPLAQHITKQTEK
ncbi:MAG: MFS transporter [Candidatus Cryptobacteroides sp.]